MKAEELLDLMKERRSIRTFEQKQIEDKHLEMILEAGLYAPNAGGKQSSCFLVTKDENVNHTLGKTNRQLMQIRKASYVDKEQPSIIDDPQKESAFYQAPIVITLLAPRDFLYGEADCCVAAQNMMLMAHALGFGSCIVSRAGLTMDSDYGKSILTRYGIDADYYRAFYHVIVGYPKGKTMQKERKQRIYK